MRLFTQQPLVHRTGVNQWGPRRCFSPPNGGIWRCSTSRSIRPCCCRSSRGELELEAWQGRALVSVVGFRFLDARIWGLAIPWHRNFEEVNLRFYVRRKTDSQWRRGVVFVKELTPRRAVATVARAIYNENFTAVPMSHQIERDERNLAAVSGVSYHWTFRGRCRTH